VVQVLLRQKLVDDADEADRLARYSGGSIQRAVQLVDPQLWSFRSTLLEQLSRPAPDSVRLARTVSAFVDEGRKQAAARRKSKEHHAHGRSASHR